MHSGGCWSSVVATAQERAALRLTPNHDWLVACVLPAGHEGVHASDGAQEHVGRRSWLLWGDYARGAQNLAAELECSAQTLDGAPCLFFGGHGGPHRYAAPVGDDFAAPVQPRSVSHVAAHARPPEPPQPAPVADRGRHGPRPLPPLPPEDDSISVSSLDKLFAGMPSLKDLPRTDVLAFPEGSFRSEAPAWPDSRGDYVAQHRPATPVEPEVVVSGPDRFEPAAAPVPEDQIIDVEAVPDPARGRRRRDEQPRRDARSSASEWLEVSRSAEQYLTEPMVEVISSNGDPVRMGVPTAHRRLPRDGEIASVTAAVENAAIRLRDLPEADGDGAVSAALHDVGQALAKLSEALRDR